MLGSQRIEAFTPLTAYLILMTVLNLLLFRCARGRRIGFRRRLGASLLAPPLIALVTIAAWVRRAMVWRGITYRLDRHGRVRSMEVTAPYLQGETSAGIVHQRAANDTTAANVTDRLGVALSTVPLD
jgi:hypothetical protein